ncbi:MAG: acetolactate synthase small subunit [Syntrophobacterales bacterium]|nr:MAG: acetolactate synthase small subunit [Syntrophobacterales bacterium]
MDYTLSVLVENHPGVLAKISGLLSGRGFNIRSIAAGETEDSTVTRIVMVMEGDDRIIDQVKKQLTRLVDVIRITDLTDTPSVDRELALVKVSIAISRRVEVFQIVDVFRGKVVDIAHNSLVVEVTGATDKVEALIEMLKPFGIKEIVRTGKISIARGETVTEKGGENRA